jgi:hypothetical protein
MACAFAAVWAFSIRARAAQAPDAAALLRSPRADVRAKIAEDIIAHRAKASGDAVNAAAAKEANPEVRIRLLTASFEVDRSSALPFLIAAVRGDNSPMVRAVSAQILARSRPDARVRQAFLDGLAKDADLDVRRSCAMGLGFQPAPDSLKALTAAAADRDPELRRRVAFALLRHPRSAAVDQVLDRLENDSDRTVAERVRAQRRAVRGEEP